MKEMNNLEKDMEIAKSNSHQLILSAPQTDLLSMAQTGLPFCIRMVQMEILMIVSTITSISRARATLP